MASAKLEVKKKEQTSFPLSSITTHSLPPAMVRPAYVGDKRSLVLAFDIGTTFSGISYVLLDPGQVPQINSVMRSVLPLTFCLQETPLNDFSLRFPAQTLTSSKIPSTIWYDANGQARAFGAEATLLETIDIADAEGWTRLD